MCLVYLCMVQDNVGKTTKVSSTIRVQYFFIGYFCNVQLWKLGVLHHLTRTQTQERWRNESSGTVICPNKFSIVLLKVRSDYF